MIDPIYKKKIKLDSVFFQKKEGDNEIIIDKAIFPLKIDNRQRLSPVDNQGKAPACVCFATCSIAESIYWKRNGYPIQFDALSLYKECKKVDGKPKLNGTFLEVGLSCAKKLGLFGNIDGKIKLINNQKDDDTILAVKAALFKYDFILGGFNITSGIYDLTDGKYILTHSGDNLGGHCMTICGWNKTGFIIQNQWGTKFGAKGFCIYPYEEFLKEFIYAAYLTNVYDSLS